MEKDANNGLIQNQNNILNNNYTLVFYVTKNNPVGYLMDSKTLGMILIVFLIGTSSGYVITQTQYTPIITQKDRDIQEQIQQIEDLTDSLETLQNNYETLKMNYTKSMNGSFLLE